MRIIGGIQGRSIIILSRPKPPPRAARSRYFFVGSMAAQQAACGETAVTEGSLQKVPRRKLQNSSAGGSSSFRSGDSLNCNHPVQHRMVDPFATQIRDDGTIPLCSLRRFGVQWGVVDFASFRPTKIHPRKSEEASNGSLGENKSPREIPRASEQDLAHHSVKK